MNEIRKTDDLMRKLVKVPPAEVAKKTAEKRKKTRRKKK